MDDRLICGNLRLCGAEAQAKYAGKIQPIEAHNQVRFFDQRCGGFARSQAWRGKMLPMRGRKRRGVVAAGQHRGADRLGKSHAPIPVCLLARDATHEDQRKLRFVNRL